MNRKSINENQLTKKDELYEPVEWRCDRCGKIKPYSDEELETAEMPKPGTKPEDWEYYIPCPFCKKGSMLPPAMSLAEGLQSILECDI